MLKIENGLTIFMATLTRIGVVWLPVNRGELFVPYVLWQRDVNVGFIERVVFCYRAVCSFSFTFPFLYFLSDSSPVRWVAVTHPHTRRCSTCLGGEEEIYMSRRRLHGSVTRWVTSAVFYINGQIERFPKPLLLLTCVISRLLSYLMCPRTPCSAGDL